MPCFRISIPSESNDSMVIKKLILSPLKRFLILLLLSKKYIFQTLKNGSCFCIFMKDKYMVLQEKYGLPSYEDLAKYFSIENIDEEDNILKEICKKMFNKIEFLADFVESLIQPDSSISTMHEASNLSKDARKNLKIYYRKLMGMSRDLLISNLEFEEEDAAKNINNIFERWLNIKDEIKELLSELRDTWSRDYEIKEDRGYFG